MLQICFLLAKLSTVASSPSKEDCPRLTLQYVSRQLDAYQIGRQSLQSSWTSSLQLYANGTQTAELVIYSRFRQLLKTFLSEDQSEV